MKTTQNQHQKHQQQPASCRLHYVVMTYYCLLTITHYIIHNVLHITSKVNVSAELVLSPPLVQCSSRQVPHRRSQCWTVSTNHSPVSRQPTNQRPESAAAANHRPGIPSHGSAEQNLLFIVITATKELREHRKF